MYKVGTKILYIHRNSKEEKSLFYGEIKETFKRSFSSYYLITDKKFGTHYVEEYDILAAYDLFAGWWFYHNTHTPTTYEAIVTKWVKDHPWDAENFKEVFKIKDLFIINANDVIGYYINGRYYINKAQRVSESGVWVNNPSHSYVCIDPKQIKCKYDTSFGHVTTTYNPHFDDYYATAPITPEIRHLNKPDVNYVWLEGEKGICDMAVMDLKKPEPDYIKHDMEVCCETKDIINYAYGIVAQEIKKDKERMDKKMPNCMKKINAVPNLNHIEQNGDYTTAIWDDGLHTVIKLQEDEFYDEEKAYLWLILKKLCHNNKSECDRVLKEFKDKTVVKD